MWHQVRFLCSCFNLFYACVIVCECTHVHVVFVCVCVHSNFRCACLACMHLQKHAHSQTVIWCFALLCFVFCCKQAISNELSLSLSTTSLSLSLSRVRAWHRRQQHACKQAWKSKENMAGNVCVEQSIADQARLVHQTTWGSGLWQDSHAKSLHKLTVHGTHSRCKGAW